MEFKLRYCCECKKELGNIPDNVYTKDMACEKCAREIIDKLEERKE